MNVHLVPVGQGADDIAMASGPLTSSKLVPTSSFVCVPAISMGLVHVHLPLEIIRE
jgi:hypothetical protein